MIENEYRVEIKIRNNLIMSKIEYLGFKSILSFCKATKISYIQLQKFINMKLSIYNSKGKIRKPVQYLCSVLNCIPEELFSASQMEASLETNKYTFQVKEAEMKYLLENYNSQKLLEDQYFDNQKEKEIEKMLDKVTPKEKKVLQMRFGLGDFSEPLTFEECAKNLGVTRERVRQIESRSLRKLRFFSDRLREFDVDQ